MRRRDCRTKRIPFAVKKVERHPYRQFALGGRHKAGFQVEQASEKKTLPEATPDDGPVQASQQDAACANVVEVSETVSEVDVDSLPSMKWLKRTLILPVQLVAAVIAIPCALFGALVGLIAFSTLFGYRAAVDSLIAGLCKNKP